MHNFYTAGDELPELTARLVALARTIPHGYWASYGDLALAAGMAGGRQAGRAAANALMPVDAALFPFWRVLSADGRYNSPRNWDDTTDYIAAAAEALGRAELFHDPDGKARRLRRWTFPA